MLHSRARLHMHKHVMAASWTDPNKIADVILETLRVSVDPRDADFERMYQQWFNIVLHNHNQDTHKTRVLRACERAVEQWLAETMAAKLAGDDVVESQTKFKYDEPGALLLAARKLRPSPDEIKQVSMRVRRARDCMMYPIKTGNLDAIVRSIEHALCAPADAPWRRAWLSAMLQRGLPQLPADSILAIVDTSLNMV